MHASNAINEICSKFPESNILTLGPLTNLALAYKLNPKLNINQIVAMAGTMHGDGNCKPVGEFNIA